MSTPQPYQYKNNLTRTNYAAERVQEFFPALSSQDSKIRLLGAKSLREFIEQESRELSSRSFNEIIEKVRKKFADMVNSDNADELRGCLTGIDEVIDVCQSHADRRILLFFHTYILPFFRL